jgi:hypothetical protein
MSEVETIKLATRFLMNINWPEDVLFLLFDKVYVRNTVYVDKFDGIEWNVVIMSPADRAFDHIESGSVLYTTVIVITALCTTFVIVCSSVLYFCRGYRTLKLMQLDMVIVILIGALVLELFCFSQVGKNNRISCTIRPISFVVGSTLYYSPMLIKTMYLNWRFSHHDVAVIKDFPKYAILVACVVIAMIISTIRLYVLYDGTSVVTVYEESDDGNKVALELCEYQTHQNTIFYQPLLLILISAAGIYFSYKNRHLPETMVGGRIILGAFIGVIVVSLVTIVSLNFIDDRKFFILIQVCGVNAIVFFGLALLFLPTFVETVYKGDKKVAEKVIKGMM